MVHQELLQEPMEQLELPMATLQIPMELELPMEQVEFHLHSEAVE